MYPVVFSSNKAIITTVTYGFIPISDSILPSILSQVSMVLIGKSRMSSLHFTAILLSSDRCNVSLFQDINSLFTSPLLRRFSLRSSLIPIESTI